MKLNSIQHQIDIILEKLMYLSNGCSDQSQRHKIHQLKNDLLNYFPENFNQLQFTGKIEDVVIGINKRLENRIIIIDEKLKINLNFYLPKDSEFSMNDVDLIKDCIGIYYPNALQSFNIQLLESIAIDEILMLIDFQMDDAMY